MPSQYGWTTQIEPVSNSRRVCGAMENIINREAQ